MVLRVYRAHPLHYLRNGYSCFSLLRNPMITCSLTVHSPNRCGMFVSLKSQLVWQPQSLYDLANLVSTTRGKSLKSTLIKLTFTVSIYQIWIERNLRKFQGLHLSVPSLVVKICTEIRCRILSLHKIPHGPIALLESWNINHWIMLELSKTHAVLYMLSFITDIWMYAGWWSALWTSYVKWHWFICLWPNWVDCVCRLRTGNWSLLLLLLTLVISCNLSIMVFILCLQRITLWDCSSSCDWDSGFWFLSLRCTAVECRVTYSHESSLVSCVFAIHPFFRV